MVKFYYLPLGTFIGIVVKVLFAYFVLAILDDKFIKYYVNIIYVSTIISFVFYFPSYIPGVENIYNTAIAPHFLNPFKADSNYMMWPNFIVYCVNSATAEPLLRNSGPFWEPGAFAGFLVIALLFNFIETRNFFEKKSKILMLGLITTLSTTGILSLFVIIAGYLLSNQKQIYKIIIIPVLIGIGMYAYNSLNFLGDKIEESMDIENAEYNTRFKSAMLDLTDAFENPLLGLGRNVETRFKGETDPVKNHRNNGVTDLMASFGIVTFLLYFYLIFLSFYKFCKAYDFKVEFAIYSIALIIMIGFSEGYFMRPFFYTLTMLHVYFRTKNKT